MIRYTKITREILNFVGDYKFITISIAAALFYPGKKGAYEMARVKLNKLVEAQELLKNKLFSGEYVFQKTNTKVRNSDLVVFNLLGKITTIADEIIYFKKEETWEQSNRRSDCHIIYCIDNTEYGLLVEVEEYNKAKSYDPVYLTGEIQQWYEHNRGYSNYFPSLLVISLNGKSSLTTEFDYDIDTLDFTLDGVDRVLGD